MDRDQIREWCSSRPGASEERPFGPETLVYKVGGKMFAALSAGEAGRSRLSLKCDPRFAEHLRATYPAVTPGYHLNKRHWNTVELDGSVPGTEIEEMLGHSYTLVAESLPRAARESLQAAGLSRPSRRAAGRAP